MSNHKKEEAPAPIPAAESKTDAVKKEETAKDAHKEEKKEEKKEEEKEEKKKEIAKERRGTEAESFKYAGEVPPNVRVYLCCSSCIWHRSIVAALAGPRMVDKVRGTPRGRA